MVFCDTPLIELHDNFLSSDECELYQNLPIVFSKSTVALYSKVDFKDSFDHSARSSESGSASGLIEDIKLRLKISAHFDIDINTMEGLQFIRYSDNQEFQPHADFFDQDHENNRVATLIIYLNENFQGGETHFPFLNIKVKPKTGSALLFKYNYSEDINKQTLHAGLPVTSGTKNIITAWIRKNPIR